MSFYRYLRVQGCPVSSHWSELYWYQTKSIVRSVGAMAPKAQRLYGRYRRLAPRLKLYWYHEKQPETRFASRRPLILFTMSAERRERHSSRTELYWYHSIRSACGEGHKLRKKTNELSSNIAASVSTWGLYRYHKRQGEWRSTPWRPQKMPNKSTMMRERGNSRAELYRYHADAVGRFDANQQPTDLDSEVPMLWRSPQIPALYWYHEGPDHWRKCDQSCAGAKRVPDPGPDSGSPERIR